MNIEDKGLILNEKISQVHDMGVREGKQKQYDEFWDAYQQNGNRVDNRYFCTMYNFTKETFKPKYPIKLSSYTFDQCMLEISLIEQGVILEAPYAASSSLGYCFRGSRLIEIPTVDISKGNGSSFAFANTPNLRKIEKIISVEKVSYVNAFQNATALEYIRFEGTIGQSANFQWCPLSTASIVNIIEHLSSEIDEATGGYKVTGQTLTLKKSATDAMVFPYTSEETNITYESYKQLEDSKPNWNISEI